jgi:exodeoxyribonuclease VII small subunit
MGVAMRCRGMVPAVVGARRGGKRKRVKKAAPQHEERDQPTFESALTRLEEIVARLDDADVPLEEAIRLVEEGDKLSRYCEQQLQEAEGKILKLVERMGEVSLEPMEVGEEPERER